MTRNQYLFLSFAVLAFALAIISAGYLVGKGFADARAADRYVTAKGLVEREVKADLAIWPITFASAGDDLAVLQRKSESDQQQVIDFLQKQGFKPEEIETEGLQVKDFMADEYRQPGMPQQFRYILRSTIYIRSNNVDLVKKVSQMTSDLVKAGVILGAGTPIRYLFTKLNELKPEMLAEATKNARTAAEQFAANSQAEISSIRRANQGVFSITPRDAAPMMGEGGASYESPDIGIYKNVRVVTTVEYLLQ